MLSTSVQDKAALVLLKCVHGLCLENIPLSKFKSLQSLLHNLGLQDIALLKDDELNKFLLKEHFSFSLLWCFKIERLYFNRCTPYTALLLKN